MDNSLHDPCIIFKWSKRLGIAAVLLLSTGKITIDLSDHNSIKALRSFFGYP